MNTGGAANGLIVQAGHVGIGTATPSNDQGWHRVLDVSGINNAKILVTESTGVKTGIFSHTGYNGKIGTESNHNLTLTAGYWNDVMTLTTASGGSAVGIGITTPGEKLDVVGNVRANGAIYSTNSGYPPTYLVSWGLSGSGNIYLEPPAGQNVYVTDNWNRTGQFNVQMANSVFNGKVGIGIDPPTHTLDVLQGNAADNILRVRNSGAENIFSIGNSSAISMGTKKPYIYRWYSTVYSAGSVPAGSTPCPCNEYTYDYQECGEGISSAVDLGPYCYELDSGPSYELYQRLGQGSGFDINGTTGFVGIGTTNPRGVLDLGDGSSGRSIVWGGLAGTDWKASIGTNAYGTINLLSGLRISESGEFEYSRTGTYAPAGIIAGGGTIRFITGSSAAHTEDADYGNAGAAASARINANGTMDYLSPLQSNGGTVSSYWASNARYVFQVTSANAGITYPIDGYTMTQLCGDTDGCRFTIAELDCGGAGYTCNRTAHLFIGEGTNNWRNSLDWTGVNGSGDNAVWTSAGWYCVFTDSDTHVSTNIASDNNTNFGLRLNTGSTRSCRLIIED